MADFALEGLPALVYGAATGNAWSYWLNLGIGVVLSTLIGGLVLVAVLKVATKAFGESAHIANAFLLALIVNIINILGVIGFLAGPLPAVAYALPLLIWLGLTKAFFSELAWTHVLLVGIVGYALSIFLVPALVAAASGFIPLP